MGLRKPYPRRLGLSLALLTMPCSRRLIFNCCNMSHFSCSDAVDQTLISGMVRKQPRQYLRSASISQIPMHGLGSEKLKWLTCPLVMMGVG